MVRISDLFALQEIDTEIGGLERSLADLQRRQGDNEDAVTLQERIAELDLAAHSAGQEQRQIGDEAEDGRAKVASVEAKLYSGLVTNAKELRDLQRDLESLQRQQAVREEKALKAMVGSESADEELQSAKQELTQGQAAWHEEQARVAGDVAGLDAQIATLQAQRQAAARAIDASTMALYERLRRMRAGRAVARVQRGACLGCRISLPSQVFQRARSGTAVVQCTSCERILFVG